MLCSKGKHGALLLDVDNMWKCLLCGEYVNITTKKEKIMEIQAVGDNIIVKKVEDKEQNIFSVADQLIRAKVISIGTSKECLEMSAKLKDSSVITFNKNSSYEMDEYLVVNVKDVVAIITKDENGE